jgi:hypothetical protein
LILVYLFLLDLLYLFNAVFLAPILFILNLLTCGRLKDFDIEEKTDKVFEVIFQLTHLEIVGFRKLRTMSQFTFESIPQIILQIRILVYMANIDASAEGYVQISWTIVFWSFFFAVVHAILEVIFLRLEADALR